jgi:hypothetical protein
MASDSPNGHIPVASTNGIPEMLDYGDLPPVEIPVKYRGKDYILREASEDTACRYKGAFLACAKEWQDGKPVRVEGLPDLEPLLVSLCLFEQLADDDPRNQPRKSDGKRLGERQLSPVEVRTWQPHVVKDLYAHAKRISKLDEGGPVTGPAPDGAAPAEEAAKN